MYNYEKEEINYVLMQHNWYTENQSFLMTRAVLNNGELTDVINFAEIKSEDGKLFCKEDFHVGCEIFMIKFNIFVDRFDNYFEVAKVDKYEL